MKTVKIIERSSSLNSNEIVYKGLVGSVEENYKACNFTRVFLDKRSSEFIEYYNIKHGDIWTKAPNISVKNLIEIGNSLLKNE